MHDDDFADAYTGLAEAENNSRWAFGTGFDDPLAGIDTSLPAGVDGPALARYCLMIGDDALVLAHRLAQWTTFAPELEEEVALANIGLDLLGQARLLLTRAASADPAVLPELPEGSPVPADDALAFFRDQSEFRNVQLVELPNGDFACSMLRLLIFSAWRLELLEGLHTSRDQVLAAIGDKGVKEVRYHLDHARRWVLTLALGTPESRRRTEEAVPQLWPYVGELNRRHELEDLLEGVAAPPLVLDLTAIWSATGLTPPEPRAITGPLGRDGRHTEHLGHVLDEMQSVARAHPRGLW